MDLGNIKTMIVVLGAPASGKGTQSEILSKSLNLKLVCMSSLIKKEIKEDKKLYNHIMNKGNLLKDEKVEEILEKEIKSFKKSFILDGYPRTYSQALFLQKLLKIYRFRLVILNIEVGKSFLEKRILSRAKIENRLDDTIKIFEKRYDIFNEDIKKIIHLFKRNIFNIKGNEPKEEVEKQISNIF